MLKLKLTESQCTAWCIVKLFTGNLDISVVKYCKCIKNTNAITGGLFYFYTCKRLPLRGNIQLTFVHVQSALLHPLQTKFGGGGGGIYTVGITSCAIESSPYLS